jgi:hypothetical protein
MKAEKAAGGKAAKAKRAAPKVTSREAGKVLQAAIDLAGANGPIAKLVAGDPIGKIEQQARKLRVLLDAILRPPPAAVPVAKKKSI